MADYNMLDEMDIHTGDMVMLYDDVDFWSGHKFECKQGVMIVIGRYDDVVVDLGKNTATGELLKSMHADGKFHGFILMDAQGVRQWYSGQRFGVMVSRVSEALG